MSKRGRCCHFPLAAAPRNCLHEYILRFVSGVKSVELMLFKPEFHNKLVLGCYVMWGNRNPQSFFVGKITHKGTPDTLDNIFNTYLYRSIVHTCTTRIEAIDLMTGLYGVTTESLFIPLGVEVVEYRLGPRGHPIFLRCENCDSFQPVDEEHKCPEPLCGILLYKYIYIYIYT